MSYQEEFDKEYCEYVFSFGEDEAKKMFLKQLEINNKIGLDNEVLVQANNDARKGLKQVRNDLVELVSYLKELKSGLEDYKFDLRCKYHSSTIFNTTTGKVDLVLEGYDKSCYNCADFDKFMKLIDRI